MSRLDRLILRELVSPWVFGVAIFTSLIMATAYLKRLTDWAVDGIDVGTLFQLSFLFVPGVMVKTFAMSALLATLLGFGRMSNDSEIVALRAGGASLFMIMRPVLIFAIGIASLAFLLNETWVPWAAMRGTLLEKDVKKLLGNLRGQPMFYPMTDGNGRLIGMITAQDFSFSKRLLTGVHIVTYDDEKRPQLIVLANKLEYKGEKDWRIEGEAKMLSADGRNYITLVDGAWPRELPQPNMTPTDIVVASLDQLDSLNMSQMGTQIERAKLLPKPDWKRIRNLEFGYYNKIALPLGAVVFALLGAPLGIRSHRAGTAVGFALSVVVSFFYLMLTNFMATWAQGGAVPSWLASFAPIIVGLIAAAIAIAKKNV